MWTDEFATNTPNGRLYRQTGKNSLIVTLLVIFFIEPDIVALRFRSFQLSVWRRHSLVNCFESVEVYEVNSWFILFLIKHYCCHQSVENIGGGVPAGTELLHKPEHITDSHPWHERSGNVGIRHYTYNEGIHFCRASLLSPTLAYLRVQQIFMLDSYCAILRLS